MNDVRGPQWARRLRIERARREWSRGDLAYRMTLAARGLGITDLTDWETIRGYTYRWEHGEIVPDWRYQLPFSSVYGPGVHELFGKSTVLDIPRELLFAVGGTVDVPHFARAEDDRMQRRAFVAWLGALAAGTTAIPQPVRQMITPTNGSPSLLPRITMHDVAELDAANAVFAHWQLTVGGVVAQQATSSHLSWAVAQLEQRVPGAPEALDAWRITTARLAETAGRSCHDAQREPQARAFLVQGYQIASTVERSPMAESIQALLLAQLAQQSIDLGRPNTGLALLQQAQGMASLLTPSTLYRLHALEARAYGGLGDRQGLERALERAEKQFGRTSADDLELGPWDRHVAQPGRMHYYTANSYRSLIGADPHAATQDTVGTIAGEYASSARTLTTDNQRMKASAQLRAAAALFAGRQLERAVEVAQEALPALPALPALRSGRIVEDARDLRRAAAPFHRRPGVHEVIEQVRAAVA